tara:strand:+ start:176 stop:721 length:546 start_codon:yes stop_codon:yes gene_type:complete
MKIVKLLPLVLVSVALFSCEPNDPTDPHEGEVITTLNVDLEAGGSTVTLNFQDVDGDGGDPPVITTDKLAANTTYAGSITLFNESETPAEELTAEIFDEAEEHQFFFATTGATMFAYSDQDNDGNPLGLSFELTTGDAGNESYTITLLHEPDKNAAGVSSGDITNAGGETDIEVVFDVVVE